jgi:MFS family permease
VVGAFGFTALVFRPIAGRIGDSRGRRIIMLVGAACNAVAVAGYDLAATAGVLVGLRLLTGAGEALFMVGAATVIHDLAPDRRRGEAVSFHSVALFGGLAIGPVIGERVLAAASFREVWLAGAACALAAALVALAVPETRPAGSTAGPSRLVHRAGLFPGVVLLMSLFGMASFYAFVPLHALDVGLAGASMVFVVFSVVMLSIRSLGARIPDSVGLARTARLSLATSALGLTVIAAWDVPTGLFVGTAVFALGQALCFPALMAIAVGGVRPHERAAVVGTFTASIDIAFAGGGVTLGLVANVAGYRGAFLAAALLGLGGLVLSARLPRAVAPPEPVPGGTEAPAP